jgi:hypothetical protein
LDAAGKAWLEKCVNGAYTTVAGVTASYQLDRWLELVINGNDYRVFYNGNKIGTAQTIADAGIPTNTTFCQFATSQQVSFSGWQDGAYTNLVKILPVGDSKTANLGAWPQYMTRFGANCYIEEPVRYATGGWTVANAKAGVDAWLATATGTPEHICMNFGANDWAVLSTTWKTDYLYIIDAMRTKWASAKVYLMRPWSRTKDTEANTRAADIADICSQRQTFCYVGPDERVFLKGSDDGTSETIDGIHPTAAYYAVTAQQWESLLP